MRKLIIALSILTLAALACGSEAPQVPPTPQDSAFDAGRTVYGFFPSPIRVELQSVFDTYERIGRHADVVLLQQNVPWKDFVERADGDSQSITDITNQMILCDRNGLEAIFVVDPLNGLNRREFADLPWGWEANFANPDVRSAFKNFALRILREYHPRYLGLASEINTYADAFPEDYPNYVSLYNEVYAAIKAESPGTQVFATFQWEDLNNLYKGANEGRARYQTNWEIVDALDPNLDLWVISTYPFGAYHSAADIPDDHYRSLLTRTTKPLAVAEGGFSSVPMESLGGSDADQIAYITKIHEQIGPRLAFWIYLIINDLDMDSYVPNMKKDQDTLAWFARMGLFDTNGNPKPALEAWDSVQK